ncbi:unnamed protein product [Schistosoma margrebowiei]|uniref:Uncharacterized protein n=1 Tax=Schistosoma margrebowiei TaxID=48269 RepID=A0A183N4Q2_9TREM|nr:unnamed protein product [Schistosoma margrebowiei]
MPVLTTRATTFIGTWNVQTLWGGSREDQSNSCGNEEIQLGETHWTQAGQQTLVTGEMLLHCGHEEENAPHTREVALMLSKEVRKALMGRESLGLRIIKASFKTIRRELQLMLCTY